MFPINSLLFRQRGIDLLCRQERKWFAWTQTLWTFYFAVKDTLTEFAIWRSRPTDR